MSKVYYDHLIVLDDIENKIKDIAETREEKEELWQLVDDIVHNRVLVCVLDNLPKDHHEEFLGMFHESPHSITLMDYLKERIKENIEELIKQEIGGLATELLGELQERE
jgi:hypothetical protein